MSARWDGPWLGRTLGGVNCWVGESIDANLRELARLDGRAPWNWARLPGLPRLFTVSGPFYIRDHDLFGEPWLTSEWRPERRSQSTSGAAR